MVDLHTVRTAARDAGFVVDGFVELMPPPFTVWQPFILASAEPSVRIRVDLPGWEMQVDRAWWQLSTRNRTIGPDGAVLLSLEGAGMLPWLKARADPSARASALGLPGQSRGFVALAVDGRAATCVSEEEYETWILADPAPADPDE